FFFARGI
ncbi:hypothetical protein MPH_12989, partial [Macrophomina phaseolina MS6]